MKNRHDTVVSIIYNLAKKDSDYQEVYADHISVGYETIDLKTKYHKRKAAMTYQYTPDIWCKYKRNRKIDIYEIWDNQLREACVEDILFSALTPNIETLSIICFEKKQYDLACELVKIILFSLFSVFIKIEG